MKLAVSYGRLLPDLPIIEQLIMPLAQKLWAGPFARIVLYGVKRLGDGSRYHIVWLSWCVNTHLTLGFYWVRYLMVMGENKMCTLKHCVYCNKPLGVTGKKSEEHIIQNALGGLLTSSEICCSECNNYLSRFIDAPFTKYFAPFLNYIPELNKTNKKKSIPGYPVGVEYNGKEYKGVAKKGKLCECGDLCKELRTKLSDIRPAPEIIYIEYPLDNKIYRNGMAKIAFNFALQKGININILKHGLIIDRDKDKITSIGFNYQIIPFFPNKRRLTWGCFMLMTVVFIFDMMLYSYPFIGDRFIPLKPRSFLFTIPMIVVIFLGCQYLNRVFRLHTINEYSKKTYVFMLIQHIMINTFMWNFEEQNLSKLGVLFSLLLVFGMTMYLSAKIVSAYKPLEDRLLHKNE